MTLGISFSDFGRLRNSKFEHYSVVIKDTNMAICDLLLWSIS